MVLKQIRRWASLSWGFVPTPLQSLCFAAFGHFPIPRKLVSFVFVSWHPPPSGWMKENTDGSALGAQGVLGGGGGTCRGFVHGSFSSPFGVGYAYETELRVAMFVIARARKGNGIACGWNQILRMWFDFFGLMRFISTLQRIGPVFALFISYAF